MEVRMHRGRPRFLNGSHRATRSGLLYLGALREILVISLATGLVLVVLSNASSIFQWNSSSEDPHASNWNDHPVLGLDFDRDKQMLIVHSRQEEFEQIDLQTGVVSKRRAPQDLVSFAMSQSHSTCVMLSEWSDGNQLQHQVYIIHGDELLLSDPLVIEKNSSGDAHISADGRTAIIVSNDGDVVCWDLRRQKPFAGSFECLNRHRQTACLRMGIRSLLPPATALRQYVTFEPAQYERLLPCFVSCNRCVSWSSDGQRLAVGDQAGGLHVFETANGHQIWQGKVDFLFARSLALSDQGNLLVTGGFDKQIRIWDLSRRTDPPKILSGESGIVHNFVFTNSSTTLISGSHDGAIREWSLATGKMTRQLR